MALKSFRPTSNGQRGRIDAVKELSGGNNGPKKSLVYRIKKARGRSKGRVTVRHKGGGAIKLYRMIDFKRDKREVPAVVKSIEYDPFRAAPIALVCYSDGTYRYILAPIGLSVGEIIQSSEKAPVKVGNALPLKSLPLGTVVHNVELSPGKGGQLVRGAGTGAQVVAREENGSYVHIKLPSGEVKRVLSACYATVGQVSNPDHKNIKLGKAGRSRHLGIRPTVRGVAQNPRSHPHGGGEGKSGVGLKYPKTPWGKHALGKRTRRRTSTDKYIVARRKR